jgi:hypothetical protein
MLNHPADGESVQHLYGYEVFQKAFLPSLVGRDTANRRVKEAYPGGVPMVGIYGGRGTGKSALCEQIHRGYVRHIPVARWPLVPGRGASAPVGADSGLLGSQVVGALNGLVIDLVAGGIGFPRFTYGLLAAATLAGVQAPPPPPPPAGILRFQAALRALTAELALASPGEAGLKALFRDLIIALLPVAQALIPGQPNLDGLARLFVNRYLAANPQGRALSWWESEIDRLPGQGARRLLRYALDLSLQNPANAANDLERRLTRAFLADIDAYRGGQHFFARPPRPLIVLDDTHCGGGLRLRNLLLDAYAPPGRDTRVERPVIVVTVRESGDRPATRPPGAAVCVSGVEPGLWSAPSRTNQQDQKHWQLWLRAPELRAGSISTEIGHQRCPQGLPNLIERLSAGRAASAHILLRAVRADLGRSEGSALRQSPPAGLGETLMTLPAVGDDVPAGEVSLRTALFGLPPVASEPTTCDALLWHLVPDKDLRTWLARWAVALHADDARHLPLAPKPAADTHYAEDSLQVREFLGDTQWERRPWQGADELVPAVSDRVLRELLLCQLRGGDPAVNEPERVGHEEFDDYWTRLNEAARACYVQGFEDGDRAARNRYLHHCLALGLEHTVVAALHHELTRANSREWLDSLQFVCAAPIPPAGYRRRNPEPVRPCRACDSPVPDAGRNTLNTLNTLNDSRNRAAEHCQLGRLLTRLRRMSQLTSVYGEFDAPGNQLRMGLNSLGAAFEDGDNPVTRAAGHWPTLLVGGRRVPDLPILTEGA